MPDDTSSRGVLAVVAAVAVCCGAAALLVGAGVIAAGSGLLGSPELTVAAVAMALWGLWRLVTTLRRSRG